MDVNSVCKIQYLFPSFRRNDYQTRFVTYIIIILTGNTCQTIKVAWLGQKIIIHHRHPHHTCVSVCLHVCCIYYDIRLANKTFLSSLVVIWKVFWCIELSSGIKCVQNQWQISIPSHILCIKYALGNRG